MGGAEKELSMDNVKGIALALLSSGFIGASFIIKKKGLRRAAVASGIRAGVGGYSYLMEPLWWVGMITMIVGEVANFVAYAFAPAVLVTPLGALSIIVSAVLAHFILNERLHALGVLGCVMCIAGSGVIVIHAPQEREITSVREIWNMATQPAFLLYVASVIVVVFVLVFHFSPLYGQSNVLIYTAICSLMGSLSVMSVKALGTSLKLTFEGTNQLVYPETWFFMLVVATCVLTQMNYLNKKHKKMASASIASSEAVYDPKTDPKRKVKSNNSRWKYGFWPVIGNRDLMQCSLCDRKISGGIKRFKVHLAGGFGDVQKMCQDYNNSHKRDARGFVEIQEGMMREALWKYKKGRPLFLDYDDEGEDKDALDTFNTAIVSPIYYVMFTTLTILASVIMFKDWSGQSLGSITSEICGLIVVLSGTILLHVTKDYERIPQSRSIYAPLSPSLTTRLNGELLKHVEDERTSDEEKVLRRREMY